MILITIIIAIISSNIHMALIRDIIACRNQFPSYTLSCSISWFTHIVMYSHASNQHPSVMWFKLFRHQMWPCFIAWVKFSIYVLFFFFLSTILQPIQLSLFTYRSFSINVYYMLISQIIENIKFIYFII